ncbi:unnamed protein product [Peronospora farinosa]|uniref:Digestive organ expansion factor n=1 Tax=Peronospora farinosa TaxID=134698 RepID=A0AAV0U8W5_9STRA|nr:unnamed protein product [Peronospora farinosa]CAI5733214.1 unnamed protein product [Peronospora farinosa]
MGLRKGGSKKKGNCKRKANVWDDAELKTKRGVIPSENDAKRSKSSLKGSMMGQWKTRKIMERTKERKFFVSVEEKKRWQREQYEEMWEHTANAIYTKNEAVEAEIEAKEDKEEEEEEDSESDVEDVLYGKKRNELFDEFVKTFKMEEDGKEEEEEEREEEMLTEEQDEEKEERENDNQVAAMEKDDEEEMEEEQQDEEEQEDPYRRRYLLSSFSEQDAKKFTATMRKFTKVDIQTLEEKLYDVTYRKGIDEDIKGIAGVVTTPELAMKKKPYVRSRLMATWKRHGLDPETVFPKGSVERALWQQLSAYMDVFFAGQTFENTATLRRLSAMHVLNHVLKARDTVTRNNERIKKRDAEKADDEEEKEYRDQGFCRASVLVLLPLRSAAVAFVNQLLKLLPANVDTFHNKDRFFREFGSAVAEKDMKDDDSTTDDGKKEWQRVFDEGNNDDCFQLGLSFSRKAVRFYSEYHHADVIIASPLGLRQQLGDEVAVLDDTESTVDVQLSSDFLSSIEVCLVDSASLMAMQNLDHLRTVLRATNVQPKEAPHADFARVREWNLTFLASFFRQTVVFAHNVEPLVHALVTKSCRNISGFVKYVRIYDIANGTASISQVVPHVKQLFQRVDLNTTDSCHFSAKDEAELRFEYFKKHVFEPLLDQPRKHVVIVIPSYFDYVRVRNLFHEPLNQKLVTSVQCCEYTPSRQVSRARTMFFHGQCHVLLYTERFHFYHQYQIRGIEQLIWYGVPMMHDFYPEMLNFMENSCHEPENFDQSAEKYSSIVLFTRMDFLRMERIVGKKRARRMCQESTKAKATFLFC